MSPQRVRLTFPEWRRIRLSWLLAASLVGLGIMVPALAAGAPRDDDARRVPTRIHDRARSDGEVRVLVELALPSNRRSEAALTTQGRNAYRQEIADTGARVLGRLAKHAHRVHRRYVTSPLIALAVGPGGLQELEAAGAPVRRVFEDRIHRPVLFDSVYLIGADQAWAQGYDGTGFVVAVIDSGVDAAHPFLAGKVVEEACFSTTQGSQSTTLCPNGAQEQFGAGAAAPCPLEEQGCWHGTHVAGIVAGNGDPADLPIWGVGKGARIMAIQVFSQINRFLDCGGAPPCLGAFTSDILAALELVYVRRTTHAFAAVNMSLGGGSFGSNCDGEEYKPFIDNLRSVGIATVVASGNDGFTDQLSAPACVSTAVSVGATTKEDLVADFSNVAPFLTLFAPGGDIISSYPGGQFAVASGTSMAAPHVAGAWAILKQAKPTASVDEVLQALIDTGVMITDTRAGTGTTRPRIQVDLALLALLYPGVPLVGSVAPDRGTVGTSLSVTVTGINFEEGTTASFGDGVTVTSTTLVSSHELTLGLTIAAAAAIGARDVTLTNPGGQTYTRPAAFTVMPPPPTLSLAFLGKLGDKVGPTPTAFAPDTALDGTFRVIVQGGIWPRTVTRLDLRRPISGIWDTDPATPYWALGVTSSLGGALLNAGNGVVSAAVPNGGALFLFASDLTPSPFATGATFTLTADFADGTSASTTVTLPVLPAISGVSPSSGAPGAALTLSVSGSNFQAPASVSFGPGADISVTSTTVVSPTQLSVAIAIGATAALGARDVTVTNGDGQVVVKPGGFTVVPPPPTVSLAFVGKQRDKVGVGPTAFAPDGALDGTFQVTVQGGIWPRTVTKLDLRQTSNGGIWDTDPATAYWALGTTASLDGALVNAANGTVNYAVANGGVFFVFASDLSPTPYSSGAGFTLTATFADGTSAAATVTLPLMPTISSVSPSSGAPGASLTVTVTGTNFQTGASASFGNGISVTSTSVVSSTQLSVAIAISSTATMGARDVTVTSGGQTALRPSGFSVAPPPPTLGFGFQGKLRDKVGANPTTYSADGGLDGTFQVTLQPGSGPRTLTRLELRRNGGGGTWDTDAATSFWALGVAASLDTALLNAANGAVSVPLTEGGAVFVFASDLSPTPFGAGSGFTLTAGFADGTTATATTTLPQVPTISSVAPSTGLPGASLTVTVTGANFQTGASASFGNDITVTSTSFVSSTQLSVAIAIGSTAALGARDVTVTTGGQTAIRPSGFTVAPPPPTLALAFQGKLRDKVGANPTTYSADGALDGTFRLTLQSGSGSRTLTRVELRRNGGGGTWDTDAATSFWALGVSASLDTALLNAANGAVNVALAEGGAVFVFASDLSPTPFSSGSGFTVTANFADGTSATATATLPLMPSITGVTPATGVVGASLTATVTGANFQPGATVSFGADITASPTVVSSTQISVALAIGASAALGARDVTVSNPDGQIAIRPAGFTVMPPPPTLSLAFLGKQRDKVGASPTAYAPDGALDGTFRVTVEAGSGPRTITRLELRRNGGPGVWHTNPAMFFWALGATTSLDGPLLNAASAVNFAVAEGGAFYAFASDFNPSPYTPGTSFSLTVTCADGSVVTVSTTVP
jgi:subtilisin family serine protease